MTKENNDDTDEYFEEIGRKNAERKKEREEERKQANKRTLKSYRIKYD